MDPVDLWPLFGIRITTPAVELRAVDPTLAFEVAALTATGIHDPGSMPFAEAWTDVPSPELERNSLRHFWERWSNTRPERWALPFAVVLDGEVAGIQTIETHDYAVLRTFETGSWLAQRFQGRGAGTEMRAAVLHLMFAELGAVEARTAGFVDNPASLAVTRKLGYEPNGSERQVRRGEAAEMLRFRMTREAWEANRRDDIVVSGLTDDCRGMLGLAET